MSLIIFSLYVFFGVALPTVLAATPAPTTTTGLPPDEVQALDNYPNWVGNICSSGSSSAPTGVTINSSAAQRVAKEASTGGATVGYALYDSTGKLLTNYNDTFKNYGASITKSMLLVAYLKQVGSGSLSSQAQSELTNMIENSDNPSANWVYAHLNNGAAQVNAVASAAGMSSFELDTSDTTYVLGQSKITANDFAKFFAKIDTFFPPDQKTFALQLLSNLSSADQNGLLQSGLPGTVYSKEGWKSENPDGISPPWIVNQAAQFSDGGNIYGVAVTVSGTSGESSGETIVKNVVAALITTSTGTPNPTGFSSSCTCSPSGAGSGPVTLTGKDNEEKIFNYFISKGLSAIQAASIDGNFGQESGWSPTDGGGYLAQWSSDRLVGLATLAAKEKKPETDLGVQLDYVWQELNDSYGDVLAHLKAATTVDDAVNQFMGPNDYHTGQPISVTDPAQRSGGYEDPGTPDGQNRVNFANGALSKYGKGAPGGPTTGCTSSGSSPDCTTATGDTKILCEAKKYDPVSYSESAAGNHMSGGNPAWLKTCPVIGPSCYLDCSGLVNIAVYDAFNYNLEENTFSEASDTSLWKHISFSQIQPGDLIQPGAYSGNHVEIIDHVQGSTIYTFGAHTSSVAQPDQVGPAQYTGSPAPGDVYLHWIGPGS